MTRIAVIGARDFTMKGKYPQAGSAAAEVILGFMEGLPKYATIISGGQFEYQDGVDSWVASSFKILKDKKKFHFVEIPPQHMLGKPYHELDWVSRRAAIVDGCDKLFVFIPTEYNGGETAEILQLARMRHIPHTVFRVDPSGDINSVLEVKSKDTFIPVEVKVSAGKNKDKSKQQQQSNNVPRSTIHRKPVRTGKRKPVQKAGTPKRRAPAPRKPRPRKSVPVPTRTLARRKRLGSASHGNTTTKSSKRVSKKPTPGKQLKTEFTVLKRKIGR